MDNPIDEAAAPVVAELALEELRLLPGGSALEGLRAVAVYQLPLRTRFRGILQREGLLLQGPAGWGEAAPFWNYDPAESSRWLKAGLEAATDNPTDIPLRRQAVPVNVTVPVVSPEKAYEIVAASGGCATAKVKVADPGVGLDEDAARLQAVRAALNDTVGTRGRVRIDANAAWDLQQAFAALEVLNRAADGLEYAEQPCPEVADLVQLRRGQEVPIAADESIRRSSDPMEVLRAGGADVAVVKVQPLGGVRSALQMAQAAAEYGVDVVFSSAIDSGVGLAQAVRAAASLPRLPHACGLATSQLLIGDVVSNPVLVKDGMLAVSTPKVDLNRLTEATLRSGCGRQAEDLASRWTARLTQILSHL